MKYFVDISPKTAQHISELISQGRYQSFGQFISAAIENQIYIEKIDLYDHPDLEGDLIAKETLKHDNIPNSQPDLEISGLPAGQNNSATLPMPRFEDLACYIKKTEFLKEENVWIWGQVNRIFPIKLGLRVLLTMLGNIQLIELEEFRIRAEEIALRYGKMIRSYERSQGKLRDERVSAGLPIDNKSLLSELILKMQRSNKISEVDSYLKQKEFKSKHRYRVHFLAHARKDGKLDGAMSFLRFINLQNRNGRTFIGLTQAGLDFGRLDNPIIDSSDFRKSLSEKEIDFYLGHVSRHVKGEYLAIKWLLNKLSEGARKREDLNAKLKMDLGQIWGVSDPVINTQRSGLMARMFELGLIDKDKRGIDVIYKLTDRGRNILRDI